jgi:hypothetical protein
MAMAEKTIGVGLIGCGNIGQIHAASWANLAEEGEAIRPVMAASPITAHAVVEAAYLSAREKRMVEIGSLSA